MKQMTLTLLSFGALLASSVALATGNPGNPEQFAKHKQEAVSDVDARIGSLQSMKSCMQGAQNHDGMQACRKTHQEQEQKMREAHKAEKQKNIDDRIQKLQDEKAKLNAPAKK